MQFFIFLIIFKIALVVLFALLGAMFVAEFFPILADKAIAVTSHTPVAEVGVLCAQALHFFANLAHSFINFIFNMLNAVGLNMDSLRERFQNPDVNLSNPLPEAPKVEKPQF